MNKKKLFSAVFPSVFVFSLILGAATVVSKFSADSQTSRATRSVYPHTHSAYKYGEDGEWDGSAYFNENTEVEIGRDYFSTDFSSLNSTDVSKSATLKFNSTRLKGWAPSNEVAFVIIDDPDFSGDESNPSLSGQTNPVFHGYTVEMRNATIKIEKFKMDGDKVVTDKTWTDLFVPAVLTYGKTFKISNDLIKAGSIEFDFDLAAYQAASDADKTKIEAKFPNYIVIPKEITEIEAGAITNIPPFVTIRSDAEAQPAQWASGFAVFADGSSHIEWEYSYLEKGTDLPAKKNTDEGKNVTQSTGLKDNYYGRLEHPMHADYIYAVMDDPNWTGDYANPTRTGGSAPYQMGAFIQNVKLDNANVYLPAVVTYSGVEGQINNIGNGAVTFPATDFDSYKYFCPVHNVRLANDAAKTAHIEEHPECKLKVASLTAYKTYYDATAAKIISATEVEEAEGKGHTVEIIYNKDYIGPVQNIYIPEDIAFINKEAFVNVPREVTFKCEVPEGTKPAGWADGFEGNGAIEWGVAYPVSKSVAASDADKEVRLSNDPTTYIAGYKYTKQNTYYCETCERFLSEEEKDTHEHPYVEILDKIPEFNEPIVIEYDIRKADGTIRKVWHEMPLKSEEETASSSASSYFDPVRSSTETRYFDILPDEGEEFLPDSVVVHNIYRAKTVKVRGQVVDTTTHKVVEKVLTYTIPDTSVRFKSVANKRYKSEVNIEDLVNYEFNGLSKFGSYSMVSMSMDRTGDQFWKDTIDPSTYETVKDKLANGTYRIRYALYNMTSSHYRVTYVSSKTGLEVTKTVAVDTPNPHYPLESKTGNKVNFLFKNSEIADDFKLSNLREFRLIGLTVNIHVWDNDNSIIVNKTSVLTHFGAIRVMPYSADGEGIFDVLLFIVVFLLIASVIYAGGSVALFFFLRNRFKNDEFRRIRPKAYIKSAIIGYLGYFVIIFTILFIAFRLGRFSNFLAVHNPLDVFIIIPGIISLVFVGYFVKFAVAKHKSNKERRKALKLKLNENVADDGTN